MQLTLESAKSLTGRRSTWFNGTSFVFVDTYNETPSIKSSAQTHCHLTRAIASQLTAILTIAGLSGPLKRIPSVQTKDGLCHKPHLSDLTGSTNTGQVRICAMHALTSRSLPGAGQCDGLRRACGVIGNRHGCGRHPRNRGCKVTVDCAARSNGEGCSAAICKDKLGGVGASDEDAVDGQRRAADVG